MEAAEPTLTCPYNKAHSIISSRMQFHLAKCRIQHPTNEKAVCPFNATHVIPHVEYDYHLSFCPNRIVLDAFTCKVGFARPPTVQLAKIEPLIIKSDENWEVSTHVRCCENRSVLDTFVCKIGSSSVPKVELINEPPQILGDEDWDVSDESPVSVLEKVHETSKTKPTLQALIGAPKSERKAFRNQERLRIQRVLDENKANEGSGMKMKGGEGSLPPKEKEMAKDFAKSVSEAAGRNGNVAEEGGPVSSQRNFNYSHNGAINAGQGQKTDFGNTRTMQGTSSRDVPRDPKNAWGTQNQNGIFGSDAHFPNLNGEAGSSKDAAARGGDNASTKNSFVDVKLKSPSPVRDPGNPWKVTKSPSTGISNNDATDPGDFPMLPVASRGRGRVRVKAK